MYDDTPRSDIGFATPRDDRFYTPRMHNNNNSSSDEWQTPRNGPWPEQGRNGGGGGGSYNSDGDYSTPRDIKEDGYIVADPHNYWNEQYRKNNAASKSYQNRDIHPDKQSKDSKRHHNQQQKQQQKQQQEDEPTEEDYDGNFGIMNGISEKDVEDIFSYARHGRCDDIERLLDRGIPLNVRDEYGNTLLIIACQNGNKKVAKLVLRRGADINARNHKGNTPLHYCFHYGYGDTLGQYLMSKGANSSIRNNAGLPCWDGI